MRIQSGVEVEGRQHLRAAEAPEALQGAPEHPGFEEPTTTADNCHLCLQMWI